MSEGFGDIANTQNVRHLGRSPITGANPEQPLTVAYEGISGGMATEWVVVLTALPEEHKAVSDHLKPFGKDLHLSEKKHSVGTVYTLGRFETSTCAWNIAIAQIDMGNTSAAIEAERAITEFHPAIMLFVGVAGGIQEKGVDLGDVIAASMVYS